ncbi:MAG: hypothetical protein IJ203_04975 [Atopobiaceae bacterium]|nr:hypothetical protein [Atopobiaceae bacterium]
MPSWNIHTAHVERLLREEDPSALGIADVNAFLFGNLVPDIYVGYMVPNPTRKIEYRKTHFADPSYVPEPRYGEFFERYVAPTAGENGQVSDVVLGAWAHLVADHVYNERFNRLLEQRGLKPGTQIRIRKQGDFNTFGRTLDISMVPQVTPGLIAQCAAFPQYAVAEPDVRATCEVMEQIVADNAAQHVSDPTYSLLGDEYFAVVPGEVDALVREGLHEYAAGRSDWGRQR